MTYGPSVQVKTWEKPQDRTRDSDSDLDDGAMPNLQIASHSKKRKKGSSGV